MSAFNESALIGSSCSGGGGGGGNPVLSTVINIANPNTSITITAGYILDTIVVYPSGISNPVHIDFLNSTNGNDVVAGLDITSNIDGADFVNYKNVNSSLWILAINSNIADAGVIIHITLILKKAS
jgi:hypothetical protein